MTFISSQRAHFVTFLCSHRIKKLLLQKVFVFLSNRIICQKRIKNVIHFVTFLSSHQIKKLVLQKVFEFLSNRKICQKKNQKWHLFRHKVFISSLFYIIIESKNSFYKNSFYFYTIEKCVKKGLEMTFISSQSVHFATFLSNHCWKR